MMTKQMKIGLVANEPHKKRSIDTLQQPFKPTFKQKVRMTSQHEDLIEKAYAAFNARAIDEALSTMQPDVQWSKAWEGGYISGHDEIRAYWTRQWKELNPNVKPAGFKERPNGSLEVLVEQKVKDLQGNLIFNGLVKHVYTFKDGLIKTMDIELADGN